MFSAVIINNKTHKIHAIVLQAKAFNNPALGEWEYRHLICDPKTEQHKEPRQETRAWTWSNLFN